MIQTEGFKFSPGGGASFALAQPTPLQFVDGRTLAPDVTVPTDVGQSLVFEASQAATKNLLSGIGVGLESILGSVTGLIKEGREEKLAEKEHERDLELVRERALYGDFLNPYEQERLKGLRLSNKKLESELTGEPYEEWLGDTKPAPMEGGEVPDPNLNVRPEDVPLEPLPEDGEQPLPPLAGATGPRQIREVGPLLEIPLSDGGTYIIDREAAKRGKTSGKYVGPGAGTVEDVQVPGFETTRMTVGPTGRVSRTMEPVPKEGAPEMSPEQLRAWNTIENRAKANTSIQNANDALSSRDIIGSNLALQNGLSDITAINAFQRMVDPGVAVREGDVTLIQQAIPRLQRYGLKAKNWVVGDQLSPEVRQQMIEAADAMLEARTKAAAPSIDELRGIAESAGINPDTVVKQPTLPESISIKRQIESLAEELDSMEDKNSEEYRTKREQLKQLVRKQQQQ
jgi:hypothetical protein